MPLSLMLNSFYINCFKCMKNKERSTHHDGRSLKNCIGTASSRYAKPDRRKGLHYSILKLKGVGEYDVIF